MHHSGLTFLLEKDGNDTAFLIGVVYLPVISARFKHKLNQVNASLFLCRLVYMVWYPGKCPELHGVLIWGFFSWLAKLM